MDTVFSQLVEPYAVKRVWARDLRHLANRLLGEVLSYTLAFLLNYCASNQPLQPAKLF